MKKYYKSMVPLNENAYENLLFLKSVIEPRIGKKISFPKLLLFLSKFVAIKIEKDSFENELIDFLKKEVNKIETN